jgi:hypothetical protein
MLTKYHTQTTFLSLTAVILWHRILVFSYLFDTLSFSFFFNSILVLMYRMFYICHFSVLRFLLREHKNFSWSNSWSDSQISLTWMRALTYHQDFKDKWDLVALKRQVDVLAISSMNLLPFQDLTPFCMGLHESFKC